MPLRVAGERRLWNGGLLAGTVYLSLHDAPYASAGNELQAGQAAADRYAQAYARLALAYAAVWTVDAATGAASNVVALSFADPPQGAEVWPGALAVGIWSEAAAGALLADAQIVGAPLFGAHGDPVRFGIGQLIFDV